MAIPPHCGVLNDMPSQEDEEVLAWQEQLLTYRRNLRHLLKQAAQFGGEDSVPLPVANDLLETRTHIRRLKSQLRTANVTVPDIPDDEQPITPSWKQEPSFPSKYRLYGVVALLAIGIIGIVIFIRETNNSATTSPQGNSATLAPTLVPSALPTAVPPAPATLLPTSAPSALPAPDITPVEMTRPNFVATDGRAIRLIVIRATTGADPGDYNILRAGGISTHIVSDHYYIDKSGNITQFVQDKDIAFHAGACNWVVDGEQIVDKKITINNQEVTVCNALSIAITLSNRNNGEDPYTALQYDALLTVTRFLVTKYDIPQSQLVRSSDISPKEPLNGFPQWSRFVGQVYSK
jgi:hypothetical protein